MAFKFPTQFRRERKKSDLVIGCGIAIHRALGPGYREPIYHRALCLELADRGISYETEKRIVVTYGGRTVGSHRLDLVIEGCVIVELKSVPMTKEIHRMQVRSYYERHGRPPSCLDYNSYLCGFVPSCLSAFE